VDGIVADLGWTCDVPEVFEPADYFICTTDTTAECGMHYDVVNVSGMYEEITVYDDDPAYYNVICDKWCGLTIGFWMNNVGKYLEGANGRQVCDNFFMTVHPSEVTGGECGYDATCNNWSCVRDILWLEGDYGEKEDKEQYKALRQIVAMNLTMALYGYGDGGMADFIIDATDFDPIPGCEDEYGYEYCVDSIREACGGSDTCPITEAWQYVLELYNPDDWDDAYTIADCINNYKFGCNDEASYECSPQCYYSPPDCENCTCDIDFGDENLDDLIPDAICDMDSSYDGCTNWVTAVIETQAEDAPPVVEEPAECPEGAVCNPDGIAPPGLQNKDKKGGN
jgi:hypothetical protein